MSPTITLPADGGSLDFTWLTDGGPVTMTARVDPPAHPPGLFIRTQAYGRADGSDWDNAGSLATHLGAFIAAVPVGETVFIRADEGPYLNAPSTTVSRVGATVRGINADYSDGIAQIKGNRTVWTLPADPEQVTSGVQNWTLGGHFIAFAEGAGYLTFRNLDLRRFGDTFYSAMADSYLDGLVIRDCTGYNVRRFFEQATTAKGLINSVFENITVTGFSKTCFRFQNDSHDDICSNVHVNSGRQNGDNFAMGFQCESAVVPSHHITFVGCVAENCHSTSGGVDGYAQGDGFVAEYGCHDIAWIDCISRGNTDGGWDIKGQGHKLIRCTAEDNKRGVRNWALDTKLLGCTLRKAHRRYGGGSQRELWCGSTSGMVTAGTYATVTLDADPETGQHCTIEASAETALAEKDKGGLRLNNTDITKPAATEMCFSASSGGGSFSMDTYTTAHIVNI